uniref:Uncharacterized protein n=1 Tax=Cucumis melo TaxID=3656 RepID=A0A9I9E8L3_CUCME
MKEQTVGNCLRRDGNLQMHAGDEESPFLPRGSLTRAYNFIPGRNSTILFDLTNLTKPIPPTGPLILFLPLSRKLTIDARPWQFSSTGVEIWW